MNSEVKEKWVAALRSGEYKQGKRALRRGDHFCCLGVLCDLAAQEGVVRTYTSPDDFTRYGNQEGALPQEVQNWAGIKESVPMVNGQWITAINDTFEASFSEIADLIEEHL